MTASVSRGRRSTAAGSPLPEVVRLDRLAARLRAALQPGDHLLWSQGAAEPTPVLEALLSVRAAAAPGHALLTLSFSTTVGPEVADSLALRGQGGLGTNRRLAAAGALAVIPVHLSQLPRLLRSREIPVDIVALQVSPPDAAGRHSLGIDASFAHAAIDAARVVVAEVNRRMPWTDGHDPVPADRFDLVVQTDRPVLEVPMAEPSPVHRAIAGHAAAHVDDGAVLQVGIGAASTAVLAELRGHVDLGVHSGLLGEPLLDLIEAGVVTNARKPVDAGRSIAGTLAGTRRLYECAGAAGILVRDAERTHGVVALAQLPKFTAINTALEVDLTGQVNAERVGNRYLGGVGGLGDFVRGALVAERGRSIVALPSTAARGERSRIAARLADGTVTVPRSDADVVVTEWGAAELRGCTVRERARRLIRIAAPAHQEELERAVRTGFL